MASPPLVAGRWESFDESAPQSATKPAIVPTSDDIKKMLSSPSNTASPFASPIVGHKPAVNNAAAARMRVNSVLATPTPTPKQTSYVHGDYAASVTKKVVPYSSPALTPSRSTSAYHSPASTLSRGTPNSVSTSKEFEERKEKSDLRSRIKELEGQLSGARFEAAQARKREEKLIKEVTSLKKEVARLNSDLTEAAFRGDTAPIQEEHRETAKPGEVDPMSVLSQLQSSPHPPSQSLGGIQTPLSNLSNNSALYTANASPLLPTSVPPSNRTPDAVQQALNNPITMLEHAMENSKISQTNILTTSGGNTMTFDASTTAVKPSSANGSSATIVNGSMTTGGAPKASKDLDPASMNFFSDLLASQPLKSAGS